MPLDKIYNNLEKLIIKMFINSGSNCLLVNASRGRAFWSQGNHYPSYKMYTIDRLLDALKYILYCTYVQFAGNIFRQIKGIPMGGNASPFIADLCLAWDEYSYMEKLIKSKTKSDMKLAKILSFNSRYIDDISTLNFLGFGEIAKHIYHPSLILEESTSGYHYDTFLDLNIRVYKNKFIIGIYHKVDDFNFIVINFPFPESNIHSKVGYNAFYSQLVRFFRLCNNVVDFIARVRLLYTKLFNRGYNEKTLSKYFLKFCSRYPATVKYGFPDGGCFWNKIKHHDDTNSYSIYNYNAIKEIIQPCNILLEDIYQKEKVRFLPVLKHCTVNLENIKSKRSVPDNSNLDHYQSIFPRGLSNPRNHCYINSVLQVLYRIFSQFPNDIHFNNNKEGCLVNYFIDNINSEEGLSNFKLKLTKFNQLFDGSIQQDAYECLVSILDIFHVGTKQNLIDGGSLLEDDQFITSLTKQIFIYTTKISLQCHNCGHLTISYSQSHTFFTYPSRDDSIGGMVSDCMTSNLKKICNRCHMDTDHDTTYTFEYPPEILMVVINRFDYTTARNKNNYSICLDREILIASYQYNLIACINHHGDTITSGHYTSNIFYTGSAYICNDLQIKPLNYSGPSNSVYMVFYKRNVRHIE